MLSLRKNKKDAEAGHASPTGVEDKGAGRDGLHAEGPGNRDGSPAGARGDAPASGRTASVTERDA